MSYSNFSLAVVCSWILFFAAPACVLAEGKKTGVSSASTSRISPGYALPERIKVLPLFFLASNVNDPSPHLHGELMKHLRWAQRRYKEMLHGRDTFEIANQTPGLIKDYDFDAAYYGKIVDDESANNGTIFRKILEKTGYNRFNNPYCYVVLLPGVYGRTEGTTMNGGFNSGGCFVLIREGNGLDRFNFQSTLQHELGHAFGLLHIWQAGYGDDEKYSKSDSPSIMSYNKKITGDTGILLPEEVKALSLNKRVFSKLYFDPEVDLASGYELKPMIRYLGAAEIPGQLSTELKITTDWGEYPYLAERVAQNQIRERWVELDWRMMWRSGPVNPLGWVSLDVEFPYAATLNGLAIHSQVSSRWGPAGRAEWVQVEFFDGSTFRYVTRERVAPDDEIRFPAKTSAKWRFAFRSSGSYVAIRGLRFFTPAGEIFPQKYPVEQHNYPIVETDFEGGCGKVQHAATGEIVENSSSAWFDETSMWYTGVNSKGWASLEVEFPYPPTLNSLEVHSGCCGGSYPAESVQVEYLEGDTFKVVTRQNLSAVDSRIHFGEMKAKRWKFAFGSSSGGLVIRGLRFHTPNGVLFSPPDGSAVRASRLREEGPPPCAENSPADNCLRRFSLDG